MRSILALADVHRRLLTVYFAVLGPRAAYAITGLLARALYGLVEPLRTRSEAHCRAALAGRVPEADIPRIAETAFVHRVWNLADLFLADRLLHKGTYARFGGRLDEPWLSRMLNAQQRGQPVILLSGYYGSFDLLPMLLGFNGIRAGVVYLPHENAAFDAYRRQVRARSGCKMIPVREATARLPAILGAGGSVALIADHHAGGRGVPSTFLGLPTRTIRSVGLLAWRYHADVVVAGIRRIGNAFRFRIIVQDVIEAGKWADQPDPVTYITERYLRGLEAIVLQDPSQYLWAYPRWGEAFTRTLTESMNGMEGNSSGTHQAQQV